MGLPITSISVENLPTVERCGDRLFWDAPDIVAGNMRMDMAIAIRALLDHHIREFQAENGARVLQTALFRRSKGNDKH